MPAAGGMDMQEQGENLAASLLSMPSKDFQKFVKDSVRSRKLSPIVVRLNRDLLSNDQPTSNAAAAALQKIGFTD